MKEMVKEGRKGEKNGKMKRLKWEEKGQNVFYP